MAVTKLLLILVVVIAQQYATTAPNVRPPTEELREQRGSEHAVPYVTTLFRILVWSWAFLEGSVLFALSDYCPPVFARSVLDVLDVSSSTLTPAFFTGVLLTLAGALLRVHCFRTLGPRFTFELSIRPSHTLVTDGVYGIVRHPSYTGAAAIAAGWWLCVFDPQGWVIGAFRANQVSIGSTSNDGKGGDRSGGIVMAFACVSVSAMGVLYVALTQRMNKEDAMLEKNFGEEWRAWARRVPCRLIPGVY